MRRVLVAFIVGSLVLASLATALEPVLLPQVAARVAADTPVDIRGTWSGIYHASIGDFPNSDTFTTEDFTTGAVTGVANNNTYTLAGTVTGNKVHWTAAENGASYVATSGAVVSADGTQLTGTGTDTNGTTGTFTFIRQTPVPSASALPSTAPSAPASAPPVVNPPGVVPPNPAPGCTSGGFGAGPPPTSTTSADPSLVGQIGSQLLDKLTFPEGLAIDAGGSQGRLFVTDGVGSGALNVVDGLPRDPADIHVVQRIPVGRFPTAVTTDPGTGWVFVAIEADCRIAVVNGRGTPTLTAEIDLPGIPSAMAFDPHGGKLFVALSQSNEIVEIGADLKVDGRIASSAPLSLAVDPTDGWLFVGSGALGSSQGSVSVLSTTDGSQIGSGVPVNVPLSLAFDSQRRVLFVVENGADQVATLGIGTDGSPTVRSTIAADPNPSQADDPVGAAILPITGQLLVSLAGQAHASLFSIQPTGALTFARSISGVLGGAAVVNDPSTGRTYVNEGAAGEVAILALDVATAAPSIAYVLPGPLDISLAPADVARSVGITAFIMLLLGAPTPIFNSTLGDNRALIERYARRKRPKRLRQATGQGGGLARFAKQLIAWSHTWTGLVLYLLLAALLYAFLDNTFPFQNAARTFGTTLFGIAVGTAVSQVPGELYVRSRYQTRGKVHVALWTLILAAACVLITRITGVQPGYVYGIIGGFTFGIALSADDHGRMAFRGMSVLLIVGLAAWFARIPFEPSVGLVSGDTGAVLNQVLADIFIGAVQGTAIGLIPLKFLTGETLFSWSRWKWAVLWGVAILFFAHVVLYPVSSFTPNPSPTGVWTILLTVVIYGAIALGFWWFFRQRTIRHERYIAKAAALFGPPPAPASEPGPPAASKATPGS
jgi:hypothetical protein